jgi:NitT/TauT family transport system substrate-binding protein
MTPIPWRAACRVAALAGLLAATAAAPAKHVVIGLSWTPQAEHCGFYEALEKGFYAKRGLDVTLQPGGPEVNNGMLLASGRIDFALTDMLALLRLRVGKLPTVAVAAYFQKDPQSLVAHPNDGIATLADLKGHTILIANAQRDGFWQWLKAKYHLDDAQLHPYAFTAAPFIADPHAVQQGYITNDGFVLGKAVPGAISLLLADDSYPNYANVVMTMAQTIATQPDTVQAVVDASAEGWRACIAGDFAAARKDILAASPSMAPELFDYSMQQIISRGLVGPDAQIGTMTDARWQAMYDAMQSVGVLPPGLDDRAAYTLQFVSRMRSP